MICSNNKICPVSTYKFGTRFFSLQGDGYFRIKLSELAINPGRFVGARKNHLVHAVFLAEWGDLEVFLSSTRRGSCAKIRIFTVGIS